MSKEALSSEEMIRRAREELKEQQPQEPTVGRTVDPIDRGRRRGRATRAQTPYTEAPADSRVPTRRRLPTQRKLPPGGPVDSQRRSLRGLVWFLFAGLVVLVGTLVSSQDSTPDAPAAPTLPLVITSPPSATAPATSVVVMPTDVGTAGNPVMLSVITNGEPGGEEALAAALLDATGLHFEVAFPDGGQEAVEWLCVDHPERGMQIMTSSLYVFAERECEAGTGLHLIRFGSDSSKTQFLVPAGSDLSRLADLDGLHWYHGDSRSITGYIVPKGVMELLGIAPLSETELADHAAVAAEINKQWQVQEYGVFGTTFVDARPAEIQDQVVVMYESPPIPNHPVVFGPDFPERLRWEIESALVEMANSADSRWRETFGLLDRWATGLDPAFDVEFNFLRSVLDAAGIGLGDL